MSRHLVLGLVIKPDSCVLLDGGVHASLGTHLNVVLGGHRAVKVNHLPVDLHHP